jgi:hypothetical protein
VLLPSYARWRGVADGWLIGIAEARSMAPSLNLTTWFSLVQGGFVSRGEYERLAGGPGWHDGERLSGPLE